MTDTLFLKPRRTSPLRRQRWEHAVSDASLKRPRLRGFLLTTTLLLGAVAITPGSASGATPATTPAVPTAIAPAATAVRPPVQLADEIVRRLRRLGINFSKTRLDRPYDPDGEVC
jgi:hypothetical protein